MDHEKRGYKKTGDFRNADIEMTNGENQLDGTLKK